jgi:hypothetical protein
MPPRLKRQWISWIVHLVRVGAVVVIHDDTITHVIQLYTYSLTVSQPRVVAWLVMTVKVKQWSVRVQMRILIHLLFLCLGMLVQGFMECYCYSTVGWQTCCSCCFFRSRFIVSPGLWYWSFLFTELLLYTGCYVLAMLLYLLLQEKVSWHLVGLLYLMIYFWYHLMKICQL